MNLRKYRKILILTLVLLVSGCTTNSLVIGYFYGRMDNSMKSNMLNYATFSKDQKSAIESSVDAFFAWHRKHEMPKYSAYLTLLIDQIESGEYDRQVIAGHLQTVRGFTRDSYEKSPVAGAAPFLQELSDAQVEEVATHIKKKDAKFLEWFEKRKQKGANKTRMQGIVKNAGRLGITFNEEQLGIIKEGVENYRGDALQRFEVWNRWEDKLLELLRDREAVNFRSDVQRHLAVYQDQMRLHDPQQHAFNQMNSANTIFGVLSSFTPEQNRVLLKKLRQTRKSLNKIASS